MYLRTKFIQKLQGVNERSTLIYKNILLSFFIKGGSILVSFLMVPMIVSNLGSERYGLWVTLTSTIAWFSFFDIGFSNGLRNLFAEAKACGDRIKAVELISTTYIVLIVVFGSLMLVFCSFYTRIQWSDIFNYNFYSNDYLRTLVLLIFSSICVQGVFQTIGVILSADQKPAFTNFINFLGQALVFLSVWILFKSESESLLELAIVVVVSPILIYILFTLILFSTEYKDYRPRLRCFKISHVGALFGLGSKFFAIQVGSLFLFQTSNIIVSNVLGNDQVAILNIAFKYFSVLTMVFHIVMSPYWSAITQALSKKEYSWIFNTINELRMYWLGVVVLGIVMLFSGPYWIGLWLKSQIIIPWEIYVMVLLQTLLSTLMSVNITVLNGLGRVNTQFKLTLLLSIPFVVVAYYTTRLFGLSGLLCINIVIFVIFIIATSLDLARFVNEYKTDLRSKNV